MAKRSITIDLYSGVPRTHIWCDTCMTFARFEVDALVLGADGVQVVGTVRQCIKCDYENGD